MYRCYPCMIILRLSLTFGWQIAKGGKGALFYSWNAVNDGKSEEYSKNSHDAEAILAHCPVDKPSKCFYQLEQP